MLFHTWPFALFFLVVYPVYLVLKGTRFRLQWLLAASYFFYACFNPLYLILIGYSTLLDYTVVTRMAKGSRRKMWLSISIINNLGLLGFFKYAGFVTENLNALLSSLHLSFAIPEPGFLLPIGISFYVFQSMSYTIDYYRGNMERENTLIAYAAFVSLFPRLLAGPIERAKNLLPQLHKTPKVSAQDVTDGLSLFIVGLFKKVALADYLALYVDNIYAAPDQYQSPALILATFLFCWQIYFDFSGYTDMARGVARMMGFNLMLNFNNPYLATDLGDFWARWHISLSSWFKDYVYIPLGGNRKGTFGTYRNMFLVMVISGLWHGAAWTFVIWGAFHALGRFVTRELERTPFYREKVPKFVKQMLVFSFVMFAWIFFRAESISDAWLIVTGILTFGLAAVLNPRCWYAVSILALLACLAYMVGKLIRGMLATSHGRMQLAVVVLLLAALAWIFVETSDLEEAVLLVRLLLTSIFSFGWPDPRCPLLALALIATVWLCEFAHESRVRWVLELKPVRIGLVAGMILYLAIFAPSSEQGFIYLQF